MKRCITLIGFLLFGLALPLGLAAMNNSDLIKMAKAGLSEDTILAAMHKEKPEYDTGTDALIALKNEGVSEKIIQQAIALTHAAEAQPATAPSDGSRSAPVLPSLAPPMVQPAVGRDYFTRFTFRTEKGRHVTTNYARGDIVPINTPVKLVSMAGSKLVLKRTDNGQEIKVENEQKYSKKSIQEIAGVMLAEQKTPIEQVPEPFLSAIRNGEMRKGMTKELVLMARGYPPAHETPSTDLDRWIYWSSRFVKQTIVFSDGRLSEGRGLF